MLTRKYNGQTMKDAVSFVLGRRCDLQPFTDLIVQMTEHKDWYNFSLRLEIAELILVEIFNNEADAFLYPKLLCNFDQRASTSILRIHNMIQRYSDSSDMSDNAEKAHDKLDQIILVLARKFINNNPELFLSEVNLWKLEDDLLNLLTRQDYAKFKMSTVDRLDSQSQAIDDMSKAFHELIGKFAALERQQDKMQEDFSDFKSYMCTGKERECEELIGRINAEREDGEGKL